MPEHVTVADHCSRPVVRTIPIRKRPCKWPLGSHLDGFVTYLLTECYSPATLVNKRALAANLSRWLDERKLTLEDLAEERLRQYRKHRLLRGDALTLLRCGSCLPIYAL